MILQCPSCAGNVTPTDADIRRGLMSCDYCQTVLRVTESGPKAVQEAVLAQEPPDGIQVLRNGGGVRIRNFERPTEEKGKQVSGKHLLISLGVSLAIGIVAWLTVGEFVPFGVIFFFGVPVLAIGSLFLLPEVKPELRLANGKLEIPVSAMTRPVTLPVSDIRQLYTTTNKMQLGERTEQLVSLLVLTQDGRRVPMSSAFASLEAAVYVEAILEIELGLFDLPVFGDEASEGQTAVSEPKPADEKMACFACNATILVGEAERRRGFVTCEHCLAVTLLYAPGTDKPLLGQPDVAKMAYAVVIEENRASLLRKADKVILLDLATPPSVQGQRVQRFVVKKTAVAQAPGLGDILSGRIAERFEKSVAYSQANRPDGQPLNPMSDLFGEVRYALLMELEKEQVMVVDDLPDVREGALLAQQLNDFLTSIK